MMETGVAIAVDGNEVLIMPLAALAHDAWCRLQHGRGWVRGPAYDVEHRMHDALVPFDRLSRVDRDTALACVRASLAEIEQVLVDAIRYTGGPARIFTLEEMRVGLAVAWADGVNGGEPPQGHGEVVSWEHEGSSLRVIRVRWPDGRVSEHFPSEGELRRLVAPQGNGMCGQPVYSPPEQNPGPSATEASGQLRTQYPAGRA